MAGEEDAGVQIPEKLALDMGRRLMETGRLGGLTPQVTADLRMKIAKSVLSQWGVRTPRFNTNGGGWIVDLSDVTGDVLFGVVRTEDGVRRLSEVVDEDVARRLLKGGVAPPAEGTRGAHGPAEPMAPAPPPEPDPGEPRLILYFEVPEGGGDEIGPPQVIRTTYSQAQQKVLPLLMRGCKVEVWSSQKVPTIKVDL